MHIYNPDCHKQTVERTQLFVPEPKKKTKNRKTKHGLTFKLRQQWKALRVQSDSILSSRHLRTMNGWLISAHTLFWPISVPPECDSVTDWPTFPLIQPLTACDLSRFHKSSGRRPNAESQSSAANKCGRNRCAAGHRHKQVVLILFHPFIPNVILVSRTNHFYFPSFSLLKEKLLLITVIWLTFHLIFTH